MSSVFGEFDDEKLLRLVNLYANERVLWSEDGEASGLTGERLLAYQRIADAMDIDKAHVNEIADKIDSIRSLYAQELELINRSQQQRLSWSSEQIAANPPYQSQYSWFSVMDSLTGDGGTKYHHERPLPPFTVLPFYGNQAQDYDSGEAHCSYAYSSNEGPSTSNTNNIQVKVEPLEYDQSQEYAAEEAQGYYGYSGGDGNGIVNIKQEYLDDPAPSENLVYGQPRNSTYAHFTSYIGSILESMPPHLIFSALKNAQEILLKYQLMNANQFEPPQ